MAVGFKEERTSHRHKIQMMDIKTGILILLALTVVSSKPVKWHGSQFKKMTTKGADSSDSEEANSSEEINPQTAAPDIVEPTVPVTVPEQVVTAAPETAPPPPIVPDFVFLQSLQLPNHYPLGEIT
ncbi:hypothetical protein AGIG_G1402 [Arapaima gigas]